MINLLDRIHAVEEHRLLMTNPTAKQAAQESRRVSHAEAVKIGSSTDVAKAGDIDLAKDRAGCTTPEHSPALSPRNACAKAGVQRSDLPVEVPMEGHGQKPISEYPVPDTEGQAQRCLSLEEQCKKLRMLSAEVIAFKASDLKVCPCVPSWLGTLQGRGRRMG